MKKPIPKTLVVLFLICFSASLKGQLLREFIDSVRLIHQIPALAVGVTTADQILLQDVSGSAKLRGGENITAGARFRLGSNTKAVTGLIAAILVKQKKISWDTRFFDLFPALKAGAKFEYHHLTLLDLLSFRTRLMRWTYTNPLPSPEQLHGNEEEQRLQFVQWILAQEPVATTGEFSFSNPAYVLAGLMLEKCSGKTYKTLVSELGGLTGVTFGFGQPNQSDSLHEPWGHGADLVPEPPRENARLNWLLPAGNLNISLADYTKFMRFLLRGAQGREKLLSQKEFVFLFEGLPGFSVGWFRGIDEHDQTFEYHIGNPGTFLSKVYVYRKQGIAFILFSNCQSEEADQGMDRVYEKLKATYLK